MIREHPAKMKNNIYTWLFRVRHKGKAKAWKRKVTAGCFSNLPGFIFHFTHHKQILQNTLKNGENH